MAKLKLISMENPKPRKKSKSSFPETVGSDKYPWNLRITLNEDQVKKIPEAMSFMVGKEVYITAKADVVRKSSSEVQTQKSGDNKDRSVEFQITDISIHGDEKAEFNSSFDEK